MAVGKLYLIRSNIFEHKMIEKIKVFHIKNHFNIFYFVIKISTV